MANPTKAAARDIASARAHHAAGNPESAARILGAIIRRAMQKRDVAAALDCSRELNLTPYMSGILQSV